MSRDPFLAAAIEEAKQSLREGGIPIGSVLVLPGAASSARRPPNMPRPDRQRHRSWRDELPAQCRAICPAQANSTANATIYSTLSPCPMCSGAIVLYKIPLVVVGENRTFTGAEDYMRSQGIRVQVSDDEECVALMRRFHRGPTRIVERRYRRLIGKIGADWLKSTSTVQIGQQLSGIPSFGIGHLARHIFMARHMQ